MLDILKKTPEVESKEIDFTKVVLRLGSPYYQKETQQKLFKKGFTWQDGTSELKRNFDYPNLGVRFLYEILVDLETKIMVPYFKRDENSLLSLVTLDVNYYDAGDLLKKIISTKIFSKKDLKRGYRPIGFIDDEPIIHPFSYEEICSDSEEDTDYAFDKLWKDLLAVSVKHMEYLLEHPKELAYIYWKYDRLLNSCRFIGQGGENPKYPISEIEEEAIEKYGEKYNGIVYDAWGFSVSNDGFPFDDDDVTDERVTNPLYELQSKQNKTMEEWIQLMTDKNYEYHSLYPNLWSVLNYLLCVIGTGFGWNKEGFIIEEGAADSDSTIFSNALFEGRPSGELKKDLDVIFESENYKKLIAFRKEHNIRSRSIKNQEKNFHKESNEILEKIEKFKKEIQAKKDSGELITDAELKLLEVFSNDDTSTQESKSQTFYPLSKEYSLLCKMPKNAHESYIKYGTDVAWDILKNSSEEKENKRQALAFLQKFDKHTDVKYKLVSAYKKGTPSKKGDDVIVQENGDFFICKIDSEESEYCKSYSLETETGVGLKAPSDSPNHNRRSYIAMKNDLKKIVEVDIVGDSRDVPVDKWKEILKTMKRDLDLAEEKENKKNTSGVRKLTSKEMKEFKFSSCVKLNKEELNSILDVLKSQKPTSTHIQREGLSEIQESSVQYGDIKLNCAFAYIARLKSPANQNIAFSNHSGLFLDSIRIFKGKDEKFYIEFSEDSARNDETFMLVAQTIDGLKDLQKVMLTLNF